MAVARLLRFLSLCFFLALTLRYAASVARRAMPQHTSNVPLLRFWCAWRWKGAVEVPGAEAAVSIRCPASLLSLCPEPSPVR